MGRVATDKRTQAVRSNAVRHGGWTVRHGGWTRRSRIASPPLLTRAVWVFLVGVVCGCSADQHQGGQHTVELSGYVYDGVTLERLTTYAIAAQYGSTTRQGSVAEDGRFRIDRMPVWRDYTVEISAEGYRDFLSINRAFDIPEGLRSADGAANVDTHQAFHFEAVMFPEGLAAPTVTINLVAPRAQGQLRGQFRLQPDQRETGSRLAARFNAGITGDGTTTTDQVLVNDADLQASTSTADFTGTEIEIPGEQLLWGVAYTLSFYNVVDDANPYEVTTQTIVAGSDVVEEVALVTVGDPVNLVASDTACTLADFSTGVPSTPTAQVIFRFDGEVELVAADDKGVYTSIAAQETLNDSFRISGGSLERPEDASATAGEEGVVVTVADPATYTVAWQPSAWSDPEPAGDTTNCVTYGGLDEVYVQRTGKPSSRVLLSDVMGSSTLSCGDGC